MLKYAVKVVPKKCFLRPTTFRQPYYIASAAAHSATTATTAATATTDATETATTDATASPFFLGRLSHRT